MDTRSSFESASPPWSRRGFLKSGVATAGALVIGWRLPDVLAPTRAATAPALAPNAYVRVGADDRVTIVVALVEMGQGIHTAVPMLIAEELDIDLAQVRLEEAPADETRYGHPLYVLQITGGSASIRGAWAALRQCGAAARAMLVAAAAGQWRVPAAECITDGGRVRHPASGRMARYRELVELAARLPVPKDVPLKDPRRFNLVGTPVPRLDTPSKVDGSARFGIDARVPGMKVAAIAIAPVIGGRLKSVRDEKARQVAGFRSTLTIDNAVAVVADHYGAARKALALLDIEWDDGPNRNFSSRQWGEQLATAIQQKGQVTLEEGVLTQAFASAARHDAVYEAPPLAHTTMEPLNATVHVRPDGCEVWVGTQAQARTQRLVSEAVGLPPERVVVHNHRVGGGFGRKLDADYVALIARFARQVSHPLKVVYSREQDLQHDAYRPYFRHELSAAMDDQGRLLGFSHRLAGSAVITRYAPVWVSKGVDSDVVHTAELPYAVPAKRVEYVRHEPPAGLMTGNWRGVGPTQNAYVTECFVDELAALAKVDALAYRRGMLQAHPRAQAVLDLAARKSDWGTALPPRQGRGLAFIDAWNSLAALVVELTVTESGEIVVDRVVCAVDCGVAVHPDGVVAQIEGGVVYGLTGVLYGAVRFEGGRVAQSNFHDYPCLRINETPKIEVHLIRNLEAPGDLGEMGTALAAPALLNAIFSATGKRFRNYPVPRDQLRRA